MPKEAILTFLTASLAAVRSVIEAPSIACARLSASSSEDTFTEPPSIRASTKLSMTLTVGGAERWQTTKYDGYGSQRLASTRS
jgi:hypothetical protein